MNCNHIEQPITFSCCNFSCCENCYQVNWEYCPNCHSEFFILHIINHLDTSQNILRNNTRLLNINHLDIINSYENHNQQPNFNIIEPQRNYTFINDENYNQQIVNNYILYPRTNINNLINYIENTRIDLTNQNMIALLQNMNYI